MQRQTLICSPQRDDAAIGQVIAGRFVLQQALGDRRGARTLSERDNESGQLAIVKAIPASALSLWRIDAAGVRSQPVAPHRKSLVCARALCRPRAGTVLARFQLRTGILPATTAGRGSPRRGRDTGGRTRHLFGAGCFAPSTNTAPERSPGEHDRECRGPDRLGDVGGFRSRASDRHRRSAGQPTRSKSRFTLHPSKPGRSNTT